MSVDKKNKSIPFSENVVFGGNFKQTITVVTKGISPKLFMLLLINLLFFGIL
jgi:hypothetical protein